MEISEIKTKANQASKSTKKLFAKLKKTKPSDLDNVTSELNEQIFSKISCLECANCCKTTSPIITRKDVSRLAKALNIKEAKLIDSYLVLDEDNDYVFKSAPCPFLNNDNTCSVYAYRPKACSEYPHLNRKKFYQILDITYKNSFICPAVYQANEALKKHYR